MIQIDDINFVKEMKNLCVSIYKEKNLVSNNWTMIKKSSVNKRGFYAEAYRKNNTNTIVIVVRGTEDGNDYLSDILMLVKVLNEQFDLALNFYNEIIKYCEDNNIENPEIIITGHSLGGSIAQYIAYLKKIKAVTFNAYGIGDILHVENNEEYKDLIHNYGNINDAIFYLKIDNQIGRTFVIDTNYDETYFQLFYHYLENIGDLEYFIEYNPLRHKKYGNVTLAQVLAKKSKEKFLEYSNKTKSKNSDNIQHSFVFEKVIKPTFQLIYNGYDVTNEFLPFIKSIMYIDFLEDECDELKIELNVTDDKLLNSWYPDKGGVLECFFKMGNQTLKCGKFTISTNNLVSTPFGSFLQIRAFAIPLNLALRTIRTDYYEKCTLLDIVKKVAERHNLKVYIPDVIDNFKIDRINQVEETDLKFLNRISKEYGYIFKLTHDMITFIKMDEYEPTFTIDKSLLHHLELEDDGVRKFKGCQINYFNPDKKKLMSVSKGDMTRDIYKIRKKFTSMEEGNILAEAILKRADFKEVTGWACLKEPLGNFISGVSFNLKDYGFFDGVYRIRKSIHELSSEGWKSIGFLEKVK